MRAFLVFSAASVTAFSVYAVPVGVEFLLVRAHASPWLACVILGDLTGCVFLFLLGLRAVALSVYILAGLLEAISLLMGTPTNRLIWATNVIPALIGGAVMFRIALRWLVSADLGS